MPQPFGKAVMTNAGARLLLRAQAGEAGIEFTRIAVGDGIYTAEEKTMQALQQLEALKSEKNSYPVSNKEIDSVHSVKVTALITNQDPQTGKPLVHTGYFINETGLFAKEQGGDGSTEVLYSIVTAAGENGDFLPPYNGYCPVQIIQDYYVTVSNSAEVTIQTSGAFVLAQDFEAFKKQVGESINSLEGRLQWLIRILCGYHYDRAQKKIVSLLPHEVKDGVLAFPEGMAYVEGDKAVLQGAGAGAFPSFPGSSFPGSPSPGGSLPGGTTSGVGSVEEVAAAAAKIVQGSLQEISQGQVMELFRSQDGENTGGETGDHPPQTGQTDSRSDR